MELRCVATCYMPGGKAKVGKSTVDCQERYEDEEGVDVYDVPEELVDTFLKSGNFEVV